MFVNALPGYHPSLQAPQPALAANGLVMGALPPPLSTRSHSAGEGPLQPGAEVKLGHLRFRIQQQLGSGSFSTVWNATRMDNGVEVAIKETLCQTPDELKDAERECTILQSVGNIGLRIPSFVACETLQLGSGAMSVRLAMVKVQGDSLGAYLQQWKSRWVGDPVSQFREACNFAYELLVQLVPTMDAINQQAVHRDINTHNVLVSIGSGRPEFSVIDFGLAMSVPDWERKCNQVPVVGDCRYWPVSAWFIFAHGGPPLMENQGLFMEYRTQIDLHAFGLTTLQVFVDMLPQMVSTSDIPQEVWSLKQAWEQYWQDAYLLWEPLYRAFERKTDWNQLRQSYIQCEAHNIIDKDLEHLRRALHNARDSCATAESGSILARAAVVFSAVVELISQGAKPLGREASKGSIRLANWLDIANILNGGGASFDSFSRKSQRGSATFLPGQSPSSTTTLPISSRSSKAHMLGSTSTPVPSYHPATTTHLVPLMGSCMSPVGSPANSPSMVISGSTTTPMASRGSFMPSFVPALFHRF
jgi:serine/threonine protein kinase